MQLKFLVAILISFLLFMNPIPVNHNDYSNNVVEHAYDYSISSNINDDSSYKKSVYNYTDDEKDKTEYIDLPVYAEGVFKSYMDGKRITNKKSLQYKQLQKMDIVDGLYMEGKYIGIAMNDFYGDIGDKFRITLSSGQVFYGVMTDIKADIHVDKNYSDKINGSVIEFIVDTKTMDKKAKKLGSLDCIYEGSIEKIEREIS